MTTLKRGLNLIVLNTVFHQLNAAFKSKFKVVTADIKVNYLIYTSNKKLILLNQKPTILKILYIAFLHINYQQVNTLHYRTNWITMFLLDLLTIEYIPSSNSFTKVF